MLGLRSWVSGVRDKCQESGVQHGGCPASRAQGGFETPALPVWGQASKLQLRCQVLGLNPEVLGVKS